MSTHNLCFEQKYEKYQNFLSEKFLFFFFGCKFSIYLNRRVFVMLISSVSAFIEGSAWAIIKSLIHHPSPLPPI